MLFPFQNILVAWEGSGDNQQLVSTCWMIGVENLGILKLKLFTLRTPPTFWPSQLKLHQSDGSVRLYPSLLNYHALAPAVGVDLMVYFSI